MLADLLYLSAICCNVNILIMSIEPKSQTKLNENCLFVTYF